MSKKPDYEIFDSLGKYMLKEKGITNSSSEKINNFCNAILRLPDSSTDAENLCKQFVHFFKLLYEEYNDPTISDNRNKYPEFLNYWLNSQFRAKNIKISPESKFYKYFINNYDKYVEENILKDKLYHIEDKYFNKMHMLYEFYKKYNEINEAANGGCTKFLDHCKTNYSEAWKKCFSEKDNPFCSALDGFRKFYDENKHSNLSRCNEEGLSSLPELLSPHSYRDTELEANKISNYLIWPTNNDSSIRTSKIKNTQFSKLYELLLLRYSFLFADNKEDKKYNMLKILQEFFQYCNENRGIPSLILFYKEFLKEYYTKNKDEYDEIYRDCSTSPEHTKSYCKVYEDVSTKYSNHLSTIKNIHDEELNEGTEKLQWLISENSSSVIISQLDKGNNILSNITPILVGTMAGGLSILFLLYKFTPFGSWFYSKILKDAETIYNVNGESDQYLFDYNLEFEMDNTENGKIHFSYHPS
ncbi:Plasmodium vivax Vir protein, putative [Plasmodium ovale]|nr:Plasmodium vivax Vir protein, putative [Plasmodium ovale]